MSRAPHVACELFLLSALFLGLAHIAFLPPWEGFDETAHYSSIEQLADTGVMPELATARVAIEIEDYAMRGPTPYRRSPPYDQNGGMTYADFFAKPQAGLDAFRGYLFGPSSRSPDYAPGWLPNWQAQHPPLYYVLQAVVARTSEDLSLGARLLLLRVVSYGLAFAGLFIAFRANRLLLGRILPGADGALIAASAWPLVLPMWFPEMARIGNDSLCAFLVGLAWWLLVKIEADGDGRKAHASLGLVLAFGCWTKAFFVPISLGILLFLVWRVMSAGNERRSARAGSIVVCGVVLAAVALPLYAWNFMQTGSILNTYEEVLLAEAGGLGAGLEKNWSLALYLRSLATIAKSFVWSGTWSFGRPALSFLGPSCALVAVVVVGYVIQVIRQRRRAPLMPLFVIGPLVAGLLYHALMSIAVFGHGTGTGGWYLYICVGPIGLIAALGACRLADSRPGQIVLVALTVAAVGFTILVSVLQVLMYGGCAIKTGSIRTLRIVTDADCWLEPARLMAKLDVIAYPTIGATAAALGLGLAAVGSFLAIHKGSRA